MPRRRFQTRPLVRVCVVPKKPRPEGRRRLFIDKMLAARREHRKKVQPNGKPLDPRLQDDSGGVCIEGREVKNKLAGF